MDKNSKLAAGAIAIIIAMLGFWGTRVEAKMLTIDTIFERLGRIEAKLDQLLGKNHD
jgi:hypothetical protein